MLALVQLFKAGTSAAAAGDRGGEITLGDVVARADLSCGRQRRDAESCTPLRIRPAR